MMRTLAWGALGGSIGALAWLLLTGDTSGLGWVLGLGIPALTVLLIMLPVLVGISGLTRLALTPEEIAAAEAEGRVGVARVDGIAETGTRINEAPVCKVQLTVAPTLGRPYSTTATETVQVIRAPQVQPGSRVVVVQTDRETGAVRLWWDAPAQWREKAAASSVLAAQVPAPPYAAPAMPAATAPTSTVAGYPASTVSGQPTAKPPRTGLRKVPRILFVLAFLVGGGVASWPHRDAYRGMVDGTTSLGTIREYYGPEASSARSAARWAAEQARQDAIDAKEEEAEKAAQAATLAKVSLFVGDNAQSAMNKLADATGTPIFASVYLTQDHVSIEAETAPGSQKFDDWYYDAVAGTIDHSGASLIQPDGTTLETLLVDVREYDLSVIPTIVKKTQKKSGITDGDPGDIGVSMLNMTSWTSDDAKQVVRPTYTVSVRDEYFSAYFTWSASGKLLSMTGGAPGSDSAKADAAS